MASKGEGEDHEVLEKDGEEENRVESVVGEEVLEHVHFCSVMCEHECCG